MMNKPPYFVDPTQDCPDPQSSDLVSAARAGDVAERRRSVRARVPSCLGCRHANSAYSRRRGVTLRYSFEVSACASRRRGKRETGTACSCAQACAAPATVCERGSVTTPLQEKRLREGDRPDPTSPETGLSRQVETLRGSGAPVSVLISPAFPWLLRLCRLRGRRRRGEFYAIQISHCRHYACAGDAGICTGRRGGGHRDALSGKTTRISDRGNGHYPRTDRKQRGDESSGFAVTLCWNKHARQQRQ